jgi:hypothetical protein
LENKIQFENHSGGEKGTQIFMYIGAPIPQSQEGQMDNSRHSDSGHRFPMPQLSEKVDMREEMGQNPLFSSNMNVHSARPSVGQHLGAMDEHTDVWTDVQME